MITPDNLLPPKKRSYVVAFCTPTTPTHHHHQPDDDPSQADHKSPPAVSMINPPVYDCTHLLHHRPSSIVNPITINHSLQNTHLLHHRPSSIVNPITINDTLIHPPNQPAYALSLSIPTSIPLTPIHKPIIVRDININNNNDNNRLLELLRQHIIYYNMDFNDISDVNILLDKELTNSDVSDAQARLALPKKQIVPLFLRHEEDAYLKQKVVLDKNAYIDVKVIMRSSVYNMRLSRWNYVGEASSWKYVLKHNWRKLRNDNNLQEGDTIRVMSFRSENRIHFAILGPKRTFSLFGTTIQEYPW